jgi:hypothetical protein
MSNNKQSSVEWLIEQLKEYDFSEEDDTYVIKIQSWVLTEKQEQAKAMHKEEIRKAYCYGEYYKDAKLTTDYYNETFGGTHE